MRDDGDHTLVEQVANPNLIRRPGYDLRRRQDSSLDQAADVMVIDAELGGGLRHGQPLSVLVCRQVSRDVIDSAYRRDAMVVPGLALARRNAHPVERGGDVLVGPFARHASDDGQRFIGGAASVFAAARLGHSQLGMSTSTPVDGEHDLARCLVEVGHDVLDERAKQQLPGSHRDSWRFPRNSEVGGQVRQIRNDGLGPGLVKGQQPLLALANALQCRLPALLQLCRNQPVVWIARGISSLGKPSLIARLLQFEVPDVSLIGLRFHVPPLRFQGCVDREWLDNTQQLARDRCIGAATAEHEAARHGEREVGPIAAVDRLRNPAGIRHRQPSPAAAAGQHACEQGMPATA
jgi:hypothetical protein